MQKSSPALSSHPRRRASPPSRSFRLSRAERQWQARAQLLQEIKSLPTTSTAVSFPIMLRLVAEFFSFDFGIVSKVAGDAYRVVASHTTGGVEVTTEMQSTSSTLCSLALERGDVVALAHLSESDACDHPALLSHSLQSFLAIPIRFRGDVVGTLAFGSATPRAERFGPADEEFMRLLALWVSVRLHSDQAMSELRQSEERFRVLSSATFEAILMSEGGVVFDANDHAATLFGYEQRENMIGRAVPELVHPDDLERVRLMAAFQREETYEARLLRADGTPFLARIQGRPIPYEGRTVRVTAVHDITEEREQAQRLQFQADVLAQVQDAVIATDRYQRIIFWNDGARRLTGLGENEVMGRSFLQVLKYEWTTEGGDLQARASLLATGQWHGEVFIHTRYGPRCAELTTTKRSGDRFDGLIVVARDVTERYTSQQELLRQARQDPLTGQFNRAAFVQRLSERHHRFMSGGTPYGVIYLDLDGFKEVNDTHGHAAGDALLQEVGTRLQRAVRRDDTVARLGGDEFAVLLNEPSHAKGIEHARQRIEQALSLPMSFGALTFKIGASLGTTLVSSEHSDVDAVLREADSKMYQHKRSRQATPPAKRVSVQPPPTAHEPLPEGHKVLYAQPIVSLGTGKISGFEVLVRWQHPTRGLLGPGAFLPSLLASEAMARFDAEILRDAVRWAATLPNLPVYVNISRRGLLDENMPLRVTEALEAAALPPHRLVVELTEQMHESEQDFAAVERLRRTGIGLCLDDFGAGHTSVALAEALPLDLLKVDRRLIGRLGPHSPVERMLEGILGMAHARDLAVVAEGIETPDQLLRARMLGFDRAQGFLFSFPVPLDAAAELLDHPPMWEELWEANPYVT